MDWEGVAVAFLWLPNFITSPVTGVWLSSIRVLVVPDCWISVPSALIFILLTLSAITSGEYASFILAVIFALPLKLL